MHFAGYLPADSPDPFLEMREKASEFPGRVVGLVSQAALEPALSGSGWSADGEGMREMTLTLGYTLFRNPADRADPANQAVLDDETRAALDDIPPWPRPAWLVEQVERMRYPQLFEAVRTTWLRSPDEHHTVEALLLEHVNHVLVNHFREQRGWIGMPWDQPAPDVTANAVQHGIRVTLDGSTVDGIQIDTDPFVYGVGAALDEHEVFTAVIPRDELAFIDLAFTSGSVVDELVPQER